MFQSSQLIRITDNPEAVEAIVRLKEVLSRAGTREQSTLAALERFVASSSISELKQMDRQAIEALANYVARELTPNETGTLLHHFLGLSPGTVASQEDASSTLVNIYDALAGNAHESGRPSVLTVTDSASADGHITGQIHSLPAGTRRVYAIFENDFALKGLDQVMAVWRNPGDDRMVFTEFEPVRQGAAYNYVWLQVKEGWPAGRYQVELFHPEAQSLLLGSESFSVR